VACALCPGTGQSDKLSKIEMCLRTAAQLCGADVIAHSSGVLCAALAPHVNEGPMKSTGHFLSCS
jgi:hypothetical protein